MDRPAKAKFGFNQTVKQRDFSIDDFQFEISGQNIVADGNADNCFFLKTYGHLKQIKAPI